MVRYLLNGFVNGWQNNNMFEISEAVRIVGFCWGCFSLSRVCIRTFPFVKYLMWYGYFEFAVNSTLSYNLTNPWGKRAGVLDYEPSSVTQTLKHIMM
jgi:hypothetical protein